MALEYALDVLRINDITTLVPRFPTPLHLLRGITGMLIMHLHATTTCDQIKTVVSPESKVLRKHNYPQWQHNAAPGLHCAHIA